MTKKATNRRVPKKVVFLTGTRADFGKIKGLIGALEKHPDFDVHVFVTGMHMSEKFGATAYEVVKCGFKNVFQYENDAHTGDYNRILSKTISGLSSYVANVNPDLIVVHGDRIEALAGALVGALSNVLVCHIEGGELSGTVDEHFRHSISKLAHIHFVANARAKKRLIQMGENKKSIHVIGSPDLDVMLSHGLPSLDEVKKHYQIPFDRYGLVLFHPVVTEIDQLAEQTRVFVDTLVQSGKDFVVIYPNNDLGNEIILASYKEKLSSNPHFKIFPSMRFEYFLTLIKNTECVVGNSSAGVREAPFYGVPAVNIGSRQANRLEGKKVPSIIHTDFDGGQILKALDKYFKKHARYKSVTQFGDGKSVEHFMKAVTDHSFWDIKIQKRFIDIE